jgi:hypothetical protein
MENFNWKILDSSNYDNFHSGDDFSYAYAMRHKYTVKIQKCKKNMYISFYIQLNMFSCMKISCTFFQ